MKSRSQMASARPWPSGVITTILFKPLSSPSLNALYKNLANCSVVSGEAKRIAPFGVLIFEKAMKPSPGSAV